ncbi:hypothetical protein AAEX28_00440 [Lentisphaerota bacterium WC36G]|nr:hypothetical protein LJT99_03320 [Lentisphaerae bacterium WC36]
MATKNKISFGQILLICYLNIVFSCGIYILAMLIYTLIMPNLCYSRDATLSGIMGIDAKSIVWMLSAQALIWVSPLTRNFNNGFLTFNFRQSKNQAFRSLYIVLIPIFFSVTPLLCIYLGATESKADEYTAWLFHQSIYIALSLFIIGFAVKSIVKNNKNLKYQLKVISFNFILLSAFALPAIPPAVNDNILKAYLRVIMLFYPILYSIVAYVELNYLPWGKKSLDVNEN